MRKKEKELLQRCEVSCTALGSGVIERVRETLKRFSEAIPVDAVDKINNTIMFISEIDSDVLEVHWWNYYKMRLYRARMEQAWKDAGGRGMVEHTVEEHAPRGMRNEVWKSSVKNQVTEPPLL